MKPSLHLFDRSQTREWLRERHAELLCELATEESRRAREQRMQSWPLQPSRRIAFLKRALRYANAKLKDLGGKKVEQ